MKTYKGLINRFRMVPKILRIALQSFRAGTYVREAKFLKFDQAFNRIMQLREVSRGITVTVDESYTLYSSILAIRDLEGAIAEVGVYKGTTAKLICEAKGTREFFLFDTFDGMPDEKITAHDNWEPNSHQDTSLDSVKSYLSQYPNLQFITGSFPESISNYPKVELHKTTFALVNLDVDLYQSTLDALEFFFPKLVVGGRLISHNYNLKDSPGGQTPGVRKAFLEYFSGCDHKIIEIAETQCMVIK